MEDTKTILTRGMTLNYKDGAKSGSEEPEEAEIIVLGTDYVKEYVKEKRKSYLVLTYNKEQITQKALYELLTGEGTRLVFLSEHHRIVPMTNLKTDKSTLSVVFGGVTSSSGRYADYREYIAEDVSKDSSKNVKLDTETYTFSIASGR